MKFTLTILFITLFTFATFADEKDDKTNAEHATTKLMVTGTIADETTGEFLVGVEVKLEGTNKKAYTDFDGNFSFEDVTPGKYSISANYISYKKAKSEEKEINIFSSKISLKLKQIN